MVNQTLAPATLPPGQRVYAVGDVHGCANRLATLHARIAADHADRPVERAWLVHLGDIVDRGPDSAAALASLAKSPPGMTTINLLGNHEAMLLNAVDGRPEAVAHWLANGGAATLHSWGIDTPTAGWTLPGDVVAMLGGWRLSFRVGPYLFVHAGLRPGVVLAAQRRADLLWIREPFLSWPDDLDVGVPGLVVVHGHTIARAPEIRRHRIGIDTGAVLGGALTCAVLEADQVGFLQA